MPVTWQPIRIRLVAWARAASIVQPSRLGPVRSPDSGQKWSQFQPDSNRLILSAASHTSRICAHVVCSGLVLIAKRTELLLACRPVTLPGSCRTVTEGVRRWPAAERRRPRPWFRRPVVPAPRGSGAPWFRRRGYAGVVGRDAGRQVAGRDADRQQVPAPMRRDVRLLGDLLGEVLLESGGQGLLADVERLRRAVIAARRADPRPSGDDSPATSTGGASSASSAGPSPESGAALREIGRMGAAQPLDLAAAVAHAFTVYFHLANLAEEHQRIRTLRERDTGGKPVRESLAAAV